ncbi:lysophospholipid acyltransferase family protein [Halomonas sp. GT]|uniref:lysophospholipid acyltransferase family protein n=1 Tax=Halomonas sp. GT TaxID=1971364 RepID=UPI0009F45E01|nr:lysophospholipid acyltransferase family protein [Halomonas sp. GT]
MTRPAIDRDAVLAAVMRGLPVSAVSALGARLGRRYAKKAWNRQARWVERLVGNLEFLNDRTLETGERRELLMAYGEQMGRVYAEIPALPRLVRSPKFHIVNEDAIHTLSGPCLIVTPHLANWETGLAVLGRALDSLYVLYEPRETEARMALAMRARQSIMPHAQFISTAQPQPMRQLMNALSQGASVSIMPDEPGPNGHIPAFGKEPLARGNRWMAARLAASQGAQILPLCVTRHEGAEMTLTVHPPLPREPRLTSREQAIIYSEKMDALFEAWVRQAPTDWYWLKDVRLY